MFWGFVFIGIGVVIIVNLLFGISLPIFKILIGLFFVYMGLKMIFGSFDMNFKKVSSSTEAIFSTSDFSPSETKSEKYVTVFGTGNLDLSSLTAGDLPKELEIDVVFGTTHVKVPKGTPLVVKSNVAFGRAKLPDNNSTSLGGWTYKSPEVTSDEIAVLKINADVVFGQIVLIQD